MHSGLTLAFFAQSFARLAHFSWGEYTQELDAEAKRAEAIAEAEQAAEAEAAAKAAEEARLAAIGAAGAEAEAEGGAGAAIGAAGEEPETLRAQIAEAVR